MTVATEAFTGQIIWTGQTTFNPGFSAEKPTDVKLTAMNVAGTIVNLVPGTQFTVTLGANGAVTINIIVAAMPAPPQTLTAFRDTPALQGVDFQDLQDFSADDHEMLHDRWARIASEGRGNLTRALRVPMGETVAPLPPPDMRKNRFIGFDNNGQVVLSGNLGDAIVGGPFYLFNDPVNGLIVKPIDGDDLPAAQILKLGGVKAIAVQAGKALVGLDEGGAFIQDTVTAATPAVETNVPIGPLLYNFFRAPGNPADATLRAIKVGEAGDRSIYHNALAHWFFNPDNTVMFGKLTSLGLEGWTIDGDLNALTHLKTSMFAAGQVREKLTAARTYFVNGTTGSDSNDGLTLGTAFLTIQKAIEVAAALDLAIFSVTINVAAGTYTQALVCRPYLGAGPITIVGAGMATTIISVTGAMAVSSQMPARYAFNGFRITAPTAGFNCFNLGRASQIDLHNIDFGPAGGVHINLTNTAIVNVLTNYTISGGGTSHISAAANCTFAGAGKIITITGTPTFSNVFLNAIQGGIIAYNGNTFVGGINAASASAACASNAVIDTGTGNATNAGNYLPGNHVATEASGGVII